MNLNQELGTTNREPGTRNRNLGTGTRNRNPEPGTRNPEPLYAKLSATLAGSGGFECASDSVLLCAGMCAAVGFAALVLHAQEPASYPHDMSDFGCTNSDENACDSAPAPPPDYNPLVGTWVRYSLLRNGFSVQPPDAPLYVKFMKDGYWSMMEFPANRPKVNKPLEQQTTKELFSRFDKMGGGWGNYSNSGQVNYRHHKAGLGPGGGENTQERAWRFEGNILILEGTGPTQLAAGSRAQTAESEARLDGARRLVGAHGLHRERRGRHDDARASAARRRRLVPRDDAARGPQGRAEGAAGSVDAAAVRRRL